ncbi:MAG: DUF5337 domain-containing protein [Paracoccaceae bacterium]
MTNPADQDPMLAKQVRLVAFVIAGTMLVWGLGNLIGRELGLQGRYAFLFDFMALAGFLWALIVTYRIWRQRRRANGEN